MKKKTSKTKLKMVESKVSRVKSEPTFEQTDFSQEDLKVED